MTLITTDSDTGLAKDLSSYTKRQNYNYDTTDSDTGLAEDLTLKD